MPADERRDIRGCVLPEGTAGAVMTREVAMLSEELTVREALEELGRQASELETIYYLYVVDDDNLLRGIVSTRQLVSSLGTSRADARRHDGDRRRRRAKSMRTRKRSPRKSSSTTCWRFPWSIGRQLLGIITHDDIIDVVREEATEDAHRIAAVAPLEEDYLESACLTLTWKRGIWLIDPVLCRLADGIRPASTTKTIWTITLAGLVHSVDHQAGGQLRQPVGDAGDHRHDRRRSRNSAIGRR